jgi:dTDP-4-dehydrorhamnose reductase
MHPVTPILAQCINPTLLPLVSFHQTGAKGTSKTRVVVTGSSGLLGTRLMSVLRGDYEVVGIDRYVPEGQRDLAVDITQKERTMESIVRSAPEVVVHTAAETDVDRCETDRDLARRINVEGTTNIADACSKVGARLILLSTDYVFDGNKGNYAETDEPSPISFYGLTKLEAERIVASTTSSSLIIRTSVLYGWHPSKLNFVTWALKGLREGQTLKVVNDHINSPTFADNLAEAILKAIKWNSRGVLHIAGSESVNRFDFARRIARQFGLDERLLVPVKMSDLNWIARRPKDSSLNVGKAEKELSIELFGVDRGLDEMARREP